MLYDRLAQLIDIDPAMLRDKITQPQHRYSQFSKAIVDQKRNKKDKALVLVSPAVRALSLLVAYRELINDLPDLQGLERIDISGTALFCAVTLILRNAPMASDAEIKSALPNSMIGSFEPIDLRGIAHIVPKDGIKEEFLGAIAILRRREKELVTDHLLLKAKQNVLSADEKQLLQQMLLDK